MQIRHFRELEVYKKAKAVALEIFEISGSFPPEERYSLIDQIRKSSRSVCANIAEAWKKRLYKAAFVAKLNDAAGESSETQVWLDFSLAHRYIDEQMFERLDNECEHVGAMLIKMLDHPDDWVIRPNGRPS